MCYIQLPSGPTSFKSTSVKPYFWPENTHNVKLDKLEAPAELDELEAPLSTLEVPYKPTKPTKPAVKRS